MNKLLMTTALVGLMAVSATSAQAGGWGGWGDWGDWGDDDCTDCVNNAVNIEQIVNGYQGAFNNIKKAGDVTDVTQTATNAANLISLDGFDVSVTNIGDVDQNTDADDFGQNADNDILAGVWSALYGISQTATNVVNVFSGPEVDDITQDADNFQRASNTIEYGLGGYDADALYDVSVDPDELLPTQEALNAANLITVAHLTGTVDQDFEVDQEALNTMEFNNWGWHHPGYHDTTLWDVGQVGTNVANIFSATSIDGMDCGCVAILQDADGQQIVVNDIIGGHWAVDMNNIVQEATNVANSISYMAPPAP